MTLSYSTLRYSCSGFGSCLSLSTVWIAKQPNQSHIIKVFKRNWSFSLKAVDTKIWMPRLLLYFLSYFLTVGEVSHCTKSCCSTKSPLHLGGDLCMSDLHHCYYSVCDVDGARRGEGDVFPQRHSAEYTPFRVGWLRMFYLHFHFIHRSQDRLTLCDAELAWAYMFKLFWYFNFVKYWK